MAGENSADGKKLEECLETCSEHPDNLIRYYCDDHKELCCDACVMLYHTVCSKKHIPTFSTRVLDSEMYQSFEAALKPLESLVSECRINLKNIRERRKKKAEHELMKIKKMRREIDRYLDSFENQLTTDIEKLYNQDEKNIDKLIEDVEKMRINIDSMGDEIKNNETPLQKSKLLINLARWQNLPKEYEERVKEVMVASRTVDYRYIASDILEVIKRKGFGFNEFISEKIDVKLIDETCDKITDIEVLQNGVVVLADRHNNKVKAIHPSHLKVTPEMSHQVSEPVTLTKMEGNKIAVGKGWPGTFTYLEISPQYHLIHDMDLAFKLGGIRNRHFCYYQCFDGSDLLIGGINSMGQVSFQRYDPAKALSKINVYLNPFVEGTFQYCSFCSQNNTVYLALKGELIHQTLDGLTVLHKYKHDQLQSPGGLTVNGYGDIYVCDRKSKTVHILSSDLKLQRILRINFGNEVPRTVAFCHKYKLLYVCTFGENLHILKPPEL